MIVLAAWYNMGIVLDECVNMISMQQIHCLINLDGCSAIIVVMKRKFILFIDIVQI
jgi:hypothetical protein